MKSDERKGIIYKWTCKITGLSYIGQTINPNRRYKTHLKNFGCNTVRSKFGIAQKDYPELKDWEYTVIEKNIERKDLNKKEVYWISYYDTFKNGLNSTTGGNQKRKIIMSDEHKNNLSKALKGRKLSDEHRRNVSINTKIAMNNPTIKEKIRQSKLGKHHFQSIETKNKISLSHIGLPAPNKGKHKVWNDPKDHSKGYHFE